MGERECVRGRKKGRIEKEEKKERADSEEEVYRKKDKGGRREKRTGATEPFRLHGHLEVESLR